MGKLIDEEHWLRQELNDEQKAWLDKVLAAARDRKSVV